MKLLGSRPINWFDANLISEVEPQYLGCDRPVYAAQRQLTGLLAYFARHFGNELWVKLWVDDGRDATSFPFADLVTSIMDIDAAFFLENIQHIYQERALAMGTMVCEGASVDLQALRDTALLTVEGTWDDIAAPGQTSAAHILCTSIPSELPPRWSSREAGISRSFTAKHGAATCCRSSVTSAAGTAKGKLSVL